jgi:hypothetical protein
MKLLRRRDLLALPLALGGMASPHVLAAAGAAVPLQLLRTGDIGGLPWIELQLQGASTRWLVDSGASAALIAPALAERLKLRPLSPWRVAMAGGVQTLSRYALPPLPGAGADADMPAIALDLQQVFGEAGARLDGALGAPWLRQRITRFDFAAGELRWAASALSVPAGAAVLPLRWDEALPVLQLALGERRAEGFVFDTGNAGALLVFAKRAEALLAETTRLPQTTVRELGGSVRAGFARIERLVAPGWLAAQVPAALESGVTARRGAHFDRLAGSLGVALFEPGAVTLDGPGARLMVELPGLPEPPPLPGGFGFRLDGGSGLRIGAVIDGGPAAAGAVSVGDAVQAIDGADARFWTPAQAWQALAGREQTVLQLFREGSSRRVELRRERFFPLLS